MTLLHLLIYISPAKCLGAQAETPMPRQMCPAISQLNYAVIKPRLQVQTGFRVSLTRQLCTQQIQPIKTALGSPWNTGGRTNGNSGSKYPTREAVIQNKEILNSIPLLLQREANSQLSYSSPVRRTASWRRKDLTIVSPPTKVSSFYILQ